jgi:tripartite-type tricarboxylate transporter receptor subunit TctC
MHVTRKKIISVSSAVAFSMCSLPFASFAQASTPFPERAVKIVVGTPPGQSGDRVARLVAQKMSVELGQSVIIENKPGAGAIVGMRAVKDAKPDGYTLMYASVGALAVNPAVVDKLPYKSEDFVAVGMVNSAPMILSVRNDVPAKTLNEFIAYTKQANPVPNYGSAGIGFTNHLTMEMLIKSSGLNMVHIPYTGDALAINGMLGGDIDAMFLTTTVALPLIRGGKIRGIAIATKDRIAVASEIPTVEEAGFKGFDVDNWGSLMAPAGTPSQVVERLNVALQTALDDEDVKRQFDVLGIRALKTSAAEATSFIAKEQTQWAAAVKAAGIKPN